MRLPHLLIAGVALLVATSSLPADPIDLDLQNPGSDYHDGPLHGQNGWVVQHQAPANADFLLSSGTGLALSENTGGSHAPTYAFVNNKDTRIGVDDFPGGQSLSFSANFFLKEATGPAKGQVLGLGWGLYSPVGPNNLPFLAEFARDPDSGGYRLRLVKQSEKTTASGETKAAITADDLGIKPTGESDPLQISLTLTNQGIPTEWTSVCILTNLATKKAFVLKNTLVAPEVYKTQELRRALVNLRRNHEDGLESVIITRLDAEVVPDPSSQ